MMVGTCNFHEIAIIIRIYFLMTWRRVLRTPPLLSGGAPQVIMSAKIYWWTDLVA